jgi:hypothetical protein
VPLGAPVTWLRSAGDVTPMPTKLAPGSAWKVE